MSQQSDMAETVYGQLTSGPIAAADIVGELRTRWGAGHGVGEIHRFVEEVAACILGHKDVEVGEVRDGRFASWTLEPWDAHFKIQQELMAMDSFFEDQNKYVFRRTPQT